MIDKQLFFCFCFFFKNKGNGVVGEKITSKLYFVKK